MSQQPHAHEHAHDTDSAVEVTRAAVAAPAVQQVGYATITRIDEGKREVTLTATSEAVDSFRTKFDYDASKDAFQRWAGNVREMHQAKAVGNRVATHFDDANRKIDVTLRISKGAEDTWHKLCDGTLKGGSIGAANVIWEKPLSRGVGDVIPVATKYDLIELSLVDNPSNPECLVSAIRSAEPDLGLLDDMDAPVATPERPKGRLGDTAALSPAIAAAMANAYGDIPDTAPSIPAPVAARVAQPTSPSEGARPMGITDHAREQAEIQAKVKQRDAAVRAAGDAAVRAADLASYQANHGSYNDYAQRVATIRGRAEAEAAKHFPPVVGRFAQAAPVAAPDAPTADAPADRNAQPDETRFVDAAMAPEAAANPVAVPDETMQHALSDQDAPSNHVHEHLHRHADGTQHAHPHRHSHEEHVLRSADAGIPHEDHAHAYRNGQVMDAALLTPDVVRGTPWQIDPAKEASADAPKLKGTQLQAAKKSVSGVTTMQPQVVGHPVMYNSEDVNMLGFAVPAAAAPVKPTPTDDVTLDPAMFHHGGHKPRVDNVNVEPGMADQDGDHDGDEDERERTEGDKIVGPGLPAFTKVTPQGMATPRMAEADETRAAQLAELATMPDELRAAFATIAADVTRNGARLSADSRDAVHGLRDGAYGLAAAAADHCGCDECQEHSPVIIALSNGEPPSMDDADDSDDEDEEDTQRVALAETQRQTAAVLGDITRALQALTQRQQDLETQQQTTISAIMSRLDDIQLTVADQQRHATAQVARTMFDQSQQTNREMQSITQHLEALAAVAAGTKADVERIAATPLPQSGPLASYAIATDKTIYGTTAQRAAAGDPMSAVQDFAATLTLEQQMDLATRLVTPSQPRAR